MADSLANEQGKDAEIAAQVAELLINLAEFKTKENKKTQYLLFLGQKEIDELKALALEHWDTLSEIAAKPAKEREKASKGLKNDIKKPLASLFNGGLAADLALFGRMLADKPEHNRSASCQVAHAISTHRVAMESDYYTAIDDLKPDDTAGSDMIGTVEFNSACFYRYSVLDFDDLAANLLGNREKALEVAEEYIRASVTAIPTGKQNSMTAHNPPSLVFAVVRDGSAPCSLANAFEKPVRPARDTSLVEGSVQALAAYWQSIVTMYGNDGIKATPVCVLDGADLGGLTESRVQNIDELVGAVKGALQ